MGTQLFNKLLASGYLRLLICIFIFGNVHLSLSQTENKSLLHDGIQRQYFIHISKKYIPKKSVPLVLAYHGRGDTSFMFMYYTKFNEIADRNNFIVVYPQGTEVNGASGWNRKNVDDVGFTQELINEIASKYNIDQERIYVTGMSNGGFMSFLLACQLSDKIAAIASVTGSMTQKMKSECAPSRRIPILQMHGTNDKAVPYNGHLKWSLPIKEVVSYWVKANEISSEPRVKKIPDKNKTDGSSVERYIYKGANNVSVEHYKVINGGHNWFGARGNMDIHASEVIWNFFSKIERE